MLAERKGKWYVMNADGTKTLGGPYDTEEEAKKRLREIEFFKHRGEHAESLPRISAVIGKRPGSDATEIQSYIFPKDHWKTPEEVQAWLRNHNLKSSLRETEDSWRAAQADPNSFDQDSFPTIALTGNVRMGELDGRWIEVFRAGDYGDKGTYGREDLEKIAANYDPRLHEAPLTVGHPETDAPAYGWVEALRVRANGTAMLEAKPRQVDQGFEDLVKAGRFTKRSVALYNDLGGRGLYLRHLAFLGAQPPEVKGLKSIFHDDQSTGVVEFVAAVSDRRNNGAETAPLQEELMEKDELKKTFGEVLREWAEGVGLAKKKEEPPVKTFSEAEVVAREKVAADAAKAAAEKEFAEKQKAAEAIALRKTQIREFIERLKPLGKWIPAFEKLGLVEFMEALPGEQTIEFGEAGKKEKKSAVEIFQKFLEGLPKIVEFGELAADRKPVNSPAEIKVVGGIRVDPHSVRLAERVEVLRKANSKLTFEEAAAQARKELGDGASTI